MTQSEVAPASSHRADDLLKQPTPFPNLRAGGRELARELELYRTVPNLIVLGIALAGVPVAYEVANHLGASLDLIIIRRLLIPEGPGSEVCAVSAAGTIIIDDRIEPAVEPSTPVEHFINEAIADLNERARTCRQNRAPAILSGRNIILVDCGIRTGSTMKAAIKALREIEPRRIICAVPVSSREGYALIASLVDDLVCSKQPEKFINAGYWYRDFRRPGDDQVGELLEIPLIT